jgi:tyrosinase
MVDVAYKYNEPLKTRFRDAAINFRLPYWDYFRPRKGPGNFTFPGVISSGQTAYDYDFSAPAIFTTPTVTVRYYPDGKPRLLQRNPLHHYAFQARSGQLKPEEWKTISTNVSTLHFILAGYSSSRPLNFLMIAPYDIPRLQSPTIQTD